MLTDLRLQKYLEGRLSPQERRDFEELLEKSPEMRARLEVLKEESEGPHLGHRRFRHHLKPDSKRGSRVRTGILLPALVVLALILALASHWFVKPGTNSTFVLQGSTGHSVELLYESPQGWRYFDAGFHIPDSLSFAVRDSGQWHIAVMVVEVVGKEARLLPVWRANDSLTFSKEGRKAIFGSIPQGFPMEDSARVTALLHYVAFFSQEVLPEFREDEASDILQGVIPQRDASSYRYQVFSVKPAELGLSQPLKKP
jgi:hypothetical protein